MHIHELFLELFSTILLFIIFVYLLIVGRKENINQHEGWNYLLLGFLLVFLGMVVDLSDNFPNLERYIILGKTVYQSFVERFFGYLLGFSLIAIGLKKWMPTIIKLKEIQKELERSHEELERKVEERTKHLLSEISRRERVEDMLRTSLRERDILLREIHHRVKNNLQIMLSLIGIKLRTTKGNTAKSVLIDLQQRIKAISLVHESLYMPENITKVNAKSYIEELVKNLQLSYGREGIEVHTSVDNIMLSIDTAISVGTMISELFLNAIKHAFPNDIGGNIYVRFERKEGVISLIVKDDGIGFYEDAKKEDRLGGLLLVNGLVQQLHGDIELVKGRGTTIRITFPHHEL